MSADHMIRRYAAYFRGWAQAFGEHQTVGGRHGGRWLIGDSQVGLILTLSARAPLPILYRELAPLRLRVADRSTDESTVAMLP